MSKHKLITFLFLSVYFVSHNIFAAETVKLTPQLRAEVINKQNESAKKLNEWRTKFVDVQIFDKKHIENTPRVVADRTAKLMSINDDEVYINKLNKVNYKKSIGVYRIGAPIKCDVSKEILGYPLYFLADATLVKYNVENDLSLVKLSSVDKEVITGDRILNKQNYNLTVKPNKDKNISGEIVSIINGVKNATKDKNVILDLGYKNKISAGDLLSVVKETTVKRTIQLHEDAIFTKDHFLTSPRDLNAAKSVTLPMESVATILVYKVFENSSLGLVIDSKETVSLHQKVVAFIKLN